MTITRFLLLLFAMLSMFSCKENKQGTFNTAIKKDRINFMLNNASIADDTLRMKLNLANNKIQKLNRIHEKYKDILKNALKNETAENISDLRRRKEFEIKILLGDSLKIEYDKLLLNQRALRLKRKK